MIPPDFQRGDEITSEALNDWSGAAESGRVAVDGSSGLVGVATASGSSFRAQLRPEGWFTVNAPASGAPSGTYQLIEQVDLEAGGFAPGPRVVNAYPTPGSTTPATNGSVIVRAWKGRAGWWFEWGAC